MIIVKDTEILNGEKLAATIGFFDGVHAGHQFLIDELKEVAHQRNLPSAVITFPEHPRVVLHSDYQPKLLNSFEEKLTHLAATGIDYCIVLDFTPELSLLTAREFITEILSKKLQVGTLLIGYDHRFGHNRKDGFEQYVTYGAACGMEVIQATKYTEGQAAVSSSEIRKLLKSGEVEQANRLLTYPYQLKGKIIDGHKIGRQLGFPTANIWVDEPFKILPASGVYAVWVYFQKKRYKGMLYIGDRPTFENDKKLSLEVNILDFCENIYNKEITVSFIRYMREDIKFNSLDALKAQLEQDRAAVNRFLSDLTDN